MIGVDLRRGLCDVIADAEHLPFHQAVFNEIYLVSILEHLDHPIKCLKEALRVSKNDADFQIVIPAEARYLPLFFRMTIFGFPFGILSALSLCRDIRKHKNLKGYLHVNCIQPRHILSFLGEATITKEQYIHPWFFGRKGKILSKIVRNRKMNWGAYSLVLKARKSSKTSSLPYDLKVVR
jgi:ubiquinone/menaquinone biosynthesis C-methylase UbiE